MDRNIKLNYSSTLEGSVLTLTCENEMSLKSTTETLSVTCDSNGSWIPNPADFIQSCSPFSTTVSPTTGTNYFSTLIIIMYYYYTLLLIIIYSGLLLFIFLSYRNLDSLVMDTSFINSNCCMCYKLNSVPFHWICLWS